jgi:hypothetical protein
MIFFLGLSTLKDETTTYSQKLRNKYPVTLHHIPDELIAQGMGGHKLQHHLLNMFKTCLDVGLIKACGYGTSTSFGICYML